MADFFTETGLCAAQLGTSLFDKMGFDGFSQAHVTPIVTNPNLYDNRVVYVNEAFARPSGYARSATIWTGRDWQFCDNRCACGRDNTK